ncbi:MAG: hypothetical protein LBN28_03890 [Desulfovibrio sp.]|jgi:predicted dienelactone hydrolase|nr:hypothetical protein [Desulfovibrio sp.]
MLRPVGMALLLFFLVYFADAQMSWAAVFYQVGFRTLGQWTAEKNLRLDVNVWYPSVQSPRVLNYAPWEITAAPEGRAVEGHFPLLLLSHASPASRFSYYDTAAWLASRGFVVAAPTHSGDCIDNMDKLFTWEQLESRARELSATMDLLLEHPQISQGIDKNRAGAIGFSAGGAAVLLLGGALPDCGGWNDYCPRAGEKDIYCNPWAKSRISTLCERLPLDTSLADPRIKAVAAVAPGFSMLFSRDSFRWFYPPVLLLAAENDTVNPPVLHTDVFNRLLNKKARYLTLKNADPAALMAPCPDSLLEDLPEFCLSANPEERQAIHQTMHSALTDFFSHYLGSDKNLPIIPDPPELTRPQSAPPPASEPAPRGKQRRKGRSGG